MRLASLLRTALVLAGGTFASVAGAEEKDRTWPVHQGWYVSRSEPAPDSPSCTMFGAGMGKPDDGSPERVIALGLVFIWSIAYAVMIDKADNLPQTSTMTFSVDGNGPFAARSTKATYPTTRTEPEDATEVLRMVAFLRSHGRLDVAANDQVYRLPLHGFNAAADDLAQCLETLPEP
ncbi:MAG: hypothetical protein ABWY78_21500 [Microvirga sp.]